MQIMQLNIIITLNKIITKNVLLYSLCEKNAVKNLLLFFNYFCTKKNAVEKVIGIVCYKFTFAHRNAVEMILFLFTNSPAHTKNPVEKS